MLLGTCLLGVVSCGRRRAAVPPAAEREAVASVIEDFTSYWLDAAVVAPATIDFGEREVTAEGLRLRVKPIRPEDAVWNQWPGDGYRLFNNRAAALFEVRVETEGRLRWLPGDTALELNREGDPLRAAESPEELLKPLLAAALDQERFVLDGDLVDRTRAAGPFRAVYMPLSFQDDALDGLIAFPFEDGDAHITGLRVTVGVQGPDGPEQLSVVYD